MLRRLNRFSVLLLYAFAFGLQWAMHIQGIANRHYSVKVIGLEKPIVFRRKLMMENLTSGGLKVFVGPGVASMDEGACPCLS